MAASLKPDEFESMPTLGDIPRHHGRARGGDIALVFEGRTTTYAEFDRHTSQVADALIAAGVQPGECVAYLGKNSDHYFELVLGAAKAGAIIAPIGWRLAAAEAAYIIDDTQAKLLFVGPECVAVAREALTQTEARPPMIAMEAGDHGLPTYEAWRDARPARDPRIEAGADATGLLLYTSGTTGRPKGVMLTSANVLRSRRKMADMAMGWNEWGEGETNLVAMPVAHIGGTGWGIVGLLNGVRNIITREFNPIEVLELVERERIVKTFMVPAALQFIVRLPRAREIDYSSLKHILYGASPMPVDLLRECMEVFG
jgi:long-chain acyl-CoA synthetase